MLPLPLRNALAALAIAALDEDDALAAVAWLAAPDAPPAPAAAARLAAVHLIDPGAANLLAVHAPHEGRIRAHATHARAAAAAHRARPAPPRSGVAGAVLRAAALWDARLFFEVHEVLEAVWRGSEGDERQALQGVIQIAVAYYHLAAGNLRGARQLMREGRARLAAAPARLAPLDDAALLAATAPFEAALEAQQPVPAAAAPRLPLKEASGA